MADELGQAIVAIKTGDKAGGIQLLKTVIQTDPNNEAAWLWLAVAVTEPSQKQDCLRRVLAINPDNDVAQRGLSALESMVELPQLEEIVTGKPLAADIELPELDDITLPPALPQLKPLPSRKKTSSPAGQKSKVSSVLIVMALLLMIPCYCIFTSGWLDTILNCTSHSLYTVKQNDFVTSLAFSPDGKILASGGAANKVFLRRASDGSVIRTMEMPDKKPGQIEGLAFSPDGQILAAGGGDTTIRLWRVSDGVLLRTIERAHAWYVQPAFSRDWKTVVSAGKKQVWLMRVQDGKHIWVKEVHTADIHTVAFSPNEESTVIPL